MAFRPLVRQNGQFEDITLISVNGNGHFLFLFNMLRINSWIEKTNIGLFDFKILISCSARIFLPRGLIKCISFLSNSELNKWQKINGQMDDTTAEKSHTQLQTCHHLLRRGGEQCWPLLSRESSSPFSAWMHCRYNREASGCEGLKEDKMPRNHCFLSPLNLHFNSFLVCSGLICKFIKVLVQVTDSIPQIRMAG